MTSHALTLWGFERNGDVTTVDLVLYDLARDATQNFSLFPHRNRDSGVCFCTPDFYSQILSVGTVLSAASSGSRKESVVGSRGDRAKYSVGGVHVAHSWSRNRSQWSDPASMSAIESGC
jgi:hypothetical protein